MTSAEFKTYRETLGLTLHHVAVLTQSSLRTASYWESRDSKVPQKAKEVVEAIEISINKAVENMVSIVLNENKLSENKQTITLLRYLKDEDLWQFIPDMYPLPVTTHSVMLAKAKQALSEKGFEIQIKYMRPGIYNVWLAGRQDNGELRAAWAHSLA
jgi:hypothetical protein